MGFTIGAGDLTVSGPLPGDLDGLNITYDIGGGGATSPGDPVAPSSDACLAAALQALATGVYPAHRSPEPITNVYDKVSTIKTALDNAPPDKVAGLRRLVEGAFNGFLQGQCGTNLRIARGAFFFAAPLPTSHCPPPSFEGIAINREYVTLIDAYNPILSEAEKLALAQAAVQAFGTGEPATTGGTPYTDPGSSPNQAGIGSNFIEEGSNLLGNLWDAAGNFIDGFLTGGIEGGQNAVTAETRRKYTQSLVLAVGATALAIFVLRR